MNREIDEILAAIRNRYSELPIEGPTRASFVSHLHSLSRWHQEPKDYVEPETVDYPERIPIAFAVCHPECGRAEFIVDGSTQECQACGSLMFRVESSWYKHEK